MSETEAAEADLASLFLTSTSASYTNSGVYETMSPSDFDFQTLDVHENYEII